MTINEQTRAAQKLKRLYKVGDRVKLVKIKDAVYEKYNGKTATIQSIDDIGQIKCSIDGGGNCTICTFYADLLKKI